MDETEYRGLRTYSQGEEDWDHTDTVQAVDEDVPVVNPLVDRPTSAPEGRLFWATDIRVLYRYLPTDQRADGDGWVPIAGFGSSETPVPGRAYLENLTVTGDLQAAIAHGDLDGVGADDHHARYTDSEATDAVGGSAPWANSDLVNASITVAGNSVALGDSTAISHRDLTSIASNDHHPRYADSEAVDAVNEAGSLDVDITGDADTLDGNDATDFADASHETDTSNPHDVTNDQVGVTSETNAEGNYELTVDGDTYEFIPE